MVAETHIKLILDDKVDCVLLKKNADVTGEIER